VVFFLKDFPVCLKILQEVLLLGYCFQKNTIILFSVEEALNQLTGIPYIGITTDLMVSSLYILILLYEFFHFSL
jgi:hypothetical protein